MRWPWQGRGEVEGCMGGARVRPGLGRSMEGQGWGRGGQGASRPNLWVLSPLLCARLLHLSCWRARGWGLSYGALAHVSADPPPGPPHSPAAATGAAQAHGQARWAPVQAVPELLPLATAVQGRGGSCVEAGVEGRGGSCVEAGVQRLVCPLPMGLPAQASGIVSSAAAAVAAAHQRGCRLTAALRSRLLLGVAWWGGAGVRGPAAGSHRAGVVHAAARGSWLEHWIACLHRSAPPDPAWRQGWPVVCYTCCRQRGAPGTGVITRA
ncbi:hypothetical protein V8C86DRAFT_2752043 [Haematococcus lacustris]